MELYRKGKGMHLGVVGRRWLNMIKKNTLNCMQFSKNLLKVN